MISELQPQESQLVQQQESDKYMHEAVESPPPLPPPLPSLTPQNNSNTNSTGDIEDASIITCRNVGINSNEDSSNTIGDKNLLKYMTLAELTSIYNSSSSRRSFATNCVRKLFSEDVWLKSNVNGKAGKERLDPDKIGCLYNTVFQFFPLSGAEIGKAAWADCVRAIDASARQIKHLKKKL